MKIEDIEKEGKIYIENLLDYHIDYTIINNEEDNYEAGREHALSEFGADIFKAGAEWMKKIFFVGKCRRTFAGRRTAYFSRILVLL